MKEKGLSDQPRISVRVPKGSNLKQRLLAASQKAKLDEPTLVLRCVEATVEYIEQHGEITLPLVVLPESALRKADISSPQFNLLRVAEDPQTVIVKRAAPAAGSQKRRRTVYGRKKGKNPAASGPPQ